jgi:uncharacterized membrane protein
MNKDLKLTGNNFSNAASATYVATLIIEVPIGRLLVPISLIRLLTIRIRRLYRSKGPASEMAWV